jgi:predicted dithiol-disulfide oxidoreductase (DUF899 family)
MPLTPATELADRNTAHHPNESSAYREARNKLLAEEIELRRHIAAVAQQRRALPLGGEIPEEYTVTGPNGSLKFSELFGNKNTLLVYSMMFGPQRKRPCPMCTSMLESWEGAARNFQQKATLAVFARSPYERLEEWMNERSWKNLKLYSDLDGAYTRTYVSPEDADMPGMNVFTKRDGRIYHFWAPEMNMEMNDPGQDPRGAPDPDSLWTMLDMTP